MDVRPYHPHFLYITNFYKTCPSHLLISTYVLYHMLNFYVHGFRFLRAVKIIFDINIYILYILICRYASA